MAPIFERHKQKPSSGSHFPLTATPFLSQTSADLPSISRLQSLFILLPGIQWIGVSSPSDPSAVVKMSIHHGLAASNSPLSVPTLPDRAPHLSQLLEPSPS